MREVEFFPMEEVHYEETKIHRQPEHGCGQKPCLRLAMVLLIFLESKESAPPVIKSGQREDSGFPWSDQS